MVILIVINLYLQRYKKYYFLQINRAGVFPARFVFMTRLIKPNRHR